jgi:hypothetical protein
MPVKKEIVYPVFLECCQFSNDVFWENIFEDLAYGKAPYGTYISKDFLCCSYKTKEFSYKIERKDPKILYDDIYELLTQKLGILSLKEKTQKKIDFHEIEKNIKQSRQDWSSIRKKNIKDYMYEQYVIDMKHKYSLSLKQCKFLLAIIMISITFKTITSKDIIYKDDKIQQITSIDFAKGKIILNKPLCSADSQNISDTPEIEESECKLIRTNWEKYLEFLREK